jgi:hypothetical protein
MSVIQKKVSIGELEALPSDWSLANNVMLRRLHEAVYPVDSQWYWYRRGKVSHTSLGAKYSKLFLSMFLMALCTSGALFPLILIAFSAYLRTVHGITTTGQVSFDKLNATEIATGSVPWRDLASAPWFIAAQCFVSGLLTCVVYVLNGEYLIRTFYTDRKDTPEEWKCQPYKYLTPERWREEKILGTTNAFIAGVYGTGLYFLHLNRPFLKFYYDITPYGFLAMFGSMLVCYLWIGELLLHSEGR